MKIERRNFDYRIIADEESLAWVVSEIQRASTIALDLETSSLDHRTGHIVGWAISWSERQGVYIPVAHSTGNQLDHSLVVDRLKPVLESGDHITCFHNAKFDTRFLRGVGINIPVSTIHDTLLEVFCAAEGHEKFDLKDLTLSIFKVKQIAFADLFPPRTKVKNISTVMIDLAGEYACEDVDYTLRIHNLYYDKVRTKFIYRMESKLWPVVQHIEDAGIRIDGEFVEAAAQFVEREAQKVSSIIYDQVESATGHRHEFNVNSGPQVGEILFDVMKLPSKRKTKTGRNATDSVALELLQDRYPVCRNILTYKSMLSNVKTVRKLKDESVDGKIYGQYRQAGATTGRFASSAPNLQNISKVKEWTVINSDGSEYTVSLSPRMAIVPDEGYYLVEMDFSAIEFIVMAALSGQKDIVDNYLAGGDVHTQNASQIFRVPMDDVTKEQRNKAKTYAYLTIYGGSAAGLADRLGMSEDEAAADIAAFYRARPHMLQWSRKVRDRARSTHKVSTFFGREQVVPEYEMLGSRAASKAERACVNRIIQGTAADYHKIGLLNTDKVGRQLRESGIDARCVLQTHDSQTWQIPDSVHPDQVVPRLTEAMAVDVNGLPRMRVESEVGASWHPLVDYEAGMDLDRSLVELREKRESAKALFGEPAALDVQAALFESGEDDVLTPSMRLLLELGDPVVKDGAAVQMVEVLRSFPGQNTVVVVADGQEMPLADYPTSLTERTLAEALRPLFPECVVRADREALVHGVMKGL